MKIAFLTAFLGLCAVIHAAEGYENENFQKRAPFNYYAPKNHMMKERNELIRSLRWAFAVLINGKEGPEADMAKLIIRSMTQDDTLLNELVKKGR